MRKYILWSAVLILGSIALITFFFLNVSTKDKFPFHFGLDLVGGTELIYRADTSKVEDVSGAMESLKEVIERRVNVFGVSEPLIQTESAGIISGNPDERLIVELPGVEDTEEAIALIGKTPILEFRLLKPGVDPVKILDNTIPNDEIFLSAELTGQYLERAVIKFDQTTNIPVIGLTFSKEGSEIFAKITREHKGEILGIVLDGARLSWPSIEDEISSGEAQIRGQFTTDEAKQLVRDLNYGALPIPIGVPQTKTIGSTLGEEALNSGIQAGIIGFIALAIFMILWYRLPGVIATLALVQYVILSLVLFKLIPVTLTAAGIAGFILSVGMAVDANILIFERTREELQRGKNIRDAIKEGFHRAWLSIRDSNISSIITAIILFWIGTSAVKGFALTLGVGVLVSMFTAITVSRTFLFAIAPVETSAVKKFLFSNGFHFK